MTLPPLPGGAALDRIAIVSDEVNADFRSALAVCLPLSIRAFELRGLTGGRMPYCDATAVDEVIALVERHALTLTGISPGFFKVACDDAKVEQELTAGLDASFALLDRLPVRRLTVFSFLRSAREAPIPQQVLDCLGQAAARCRAAGVELLIENSASCWADTGAHLAELAHAVHVGVTWDPANSQAAGQCAYPDGYTVVRSQVCHVHLKNWDPVRGPVALLDGQADIAGQVAALLAEGYPGYYCLEPHQWSNGPAAAALNHAQLSALLARGSSHAH